MEEKSQGLLLQTIPHLGVGRILKIFTQEAGLIPIFTKKKNLGSMASPFCIGEWVYKKGTGDLYSLKDASLIDPLLDLRQSFAAISSAGVMAQAVLKSQLPAQSSQLLYELLVSYIKKLPQFTHPHTLAISFQFKLLLHEGLLSLKPECTHCGLPAKHLSQGESFCPSHARLPGIAFTTQEWHDLHILTFSQKFSALQQLTLAPPFLEKSNSILETLSYRM